MKVKRCFALIAVIITALWLISAYVDAEKMQEINALDLSVKPQSINSRGSVKPDLNFGKFPLYFIFNKGQVNKKARFYAKASRYTLWLTKEGLVFDSTRKVEVEKGKQTTDDRRQMTDYSPHSPYSPYSPHSPHSPKLERDVSRLVFLDANKNPEIVPIEEAKLKVNYFIGNDKSKWHCDVPTSQAVLYKNLYKNIDLKVYGIEKQIEYDWVVKPGGNPKEIRFEYKNVKGTRIDEEGNLLIETDFGELMHKKPVSYQKRKAQSAGRTAECTGVGAGPLTCPKDRRDINVTFKKISNNTYGFEVGEYDRDYELIIDPVVLAYSTYLGGNAYEFARGIAVDNMGYAYVTGETQSTDFPILNQYQKFQGYCDTFVTKLDTTESGALSLVYSTYLGGGLNDYGKGIAVDNKGNAYVTGLTWSSDFPTLNQYQTDQWSYDAFVTKLDTTQNGASGLIYSTYLGGWSVDYGLGIAVDNSENAFVTGMTYSMDFPILNQYQTYQGDRDAFVTKLDTTKSGTSSLVYSTYLGGIADELGIGIAIDSSGKAYVTGWTYSPDFPTLNQYQDDQGVGDAFITKIDTTQSGSSSLIYSTYLGGNSSDVGWAIAVDSSGNAYVTGQTSSTDFPTLNQYQTDPGDNNNDVFVTKINTTQGGSSSLIYSTYLGGNSGDVSWAIAVDSSGNTYVTGQTSSTDFPTLNQYQTDSGDNNEDVFVTKVDTTQAGTLSLIYSTYIGSWGHEIGFGIAVDSIGNAYVTGYTDSTNFPTLNQYQTNQPHVDAFVTKLSFIPPNLPPVAVCKDIEISADENCQAAIIAEYVDDESYDPDDDPITLSIDNSGPFSLGEHEVNLTVTDEHGESDTCQAKVTVVDMTPPIIESLSASPNVLWPPNHKMVAVTLVVTAFDNCDPAPESKIVSVSSNEPVNGTGDGDSGPDWEITGDLTVNLRAERSGTGSGRVYTVTVMCTDAYVNSSTEVINIIVPHNKR